MSDTAQVGVPPVKSERYSAQEKEVFARRLSEFFPYYSQHDQETALHAVLAYRQVVFRTSLTHSLLANHAVLDYVEPIIDKYCAQYDVPERPFKAIISWENSGSVDRVSWANARGVSQMTQGAVESAHNYAVRRAQTYRSQAEASASEEEYQLWNLKAEKLEKIAERHAQAAKKNSVEDERQLLEANIEDAVLFFAYMLECYEGREDLAISAYHNGVINNDDVLAQYGSRIDGWAWNTHEALLDGLSYWNVTYADLWNNNYTRGILNGWRTVYGDVTTAENAHLALTDESDLYVWKVAASWCAWREGEAFTQMMINRCRGRRGEVETASYPSWETPSQLTEAMAAHNPALKTLTAPVQNLLSANPSLSAQAQRLLSPHLDNYLNDLAERFRETVKRPEARLPVCALNSVGLRGAQACCDLSPVTHYRGLACDLDLSKMNPAEARQLLNLLQYDYLFDVIYLSRHGKKVHLVYNVPEW